ncbi:MAG: DUF58 domain-containing protein [Ideonella sp. MAG2]|nr:MAG: DUF58 domain-containing protein [Ideonella sp. MAG2]
MRSPKAWWRDWWLARLRPVAMHTLTQRNVYILPTRAGWAFGLTLLLLLVAAINYQLNLGYALTFLLAGAAAASLHITHASLRGLSLQVRPPQPTHAGQDMSLEISIHNPGRPRHGLGFGLQGREPKVWVDAAADGVTAVVLSTVSHRRGHHELPALQVECRFPFGLFRAWSLWRPAGQAWVYPALEASPGALPRWADSPEDGGSLNRSGRDEVEGIRPWQRGDSLRQVAWKKVARTGELVSRDRSGRVAARLWLDWSLIQVPSTEARLSRLATWVVAAEAQGLQWGLRLGADELALGHGQAHQEAALQRLALFKGGAS